MAYINVTDGFMDVNNPPVPLTALCATPAPQRRCSPSPTPGEALLPQLLNGVQDTFPVKGDYDGNTGSLNWSDIWQEKLDGGDPGGGDIKVDEKDECPDAICLSVREGNPDYAVYREADLEGAVSAVLTYSYNNLLERKNGSPKTMWSSWKLRAAAATLKSRGAYGR